MEACRNMNIINRSTKLLACLIWINPDEPGEQEMSSVGIHCITEKRP
jgi:hypothetical protein